jgi:SPP1 family predicted phage head-tail adaptor
MTLGAGRFDRLVAWDQPFVTQDASGSEIVTFVEAFTTQACIRPLKGRELLQLRETYAELDTMITIRWSVRNATINAKWRGRYDGTIYNIASPPVDIEMAHRELEIACKSGLNEG